jgi:hypothetical protein
MSSQDKLILVFALGFLIKVACLVFEISSVQASTVLNIIN